MATGSLARSPTAGMGARKEAAIAHTRLLYLDNVRVALITLVVIGHLAITYGAQGDWFYREPAEPNIVVSVLFVFLLGIGASFLLGLFFLMAAYLTPAAYDRKGARRFVVDRLLRLGIPLLIFAFFFTPLNECAITKHADPSISFWRCVPGELPGMDGSGVSVMWFVELLLIFSLLYVAWRQFIDAAGPRGYATRSAEYVPSNSAIALFALTLGLLTFLVRLIAPVNWWWEPLHLESAHLPQYVFFFVAGLLAYHGGWFEKLFAERAQTWRWVALAGVLLLPVLAVAAGALSGELNDDGAGGWNWMSLAYSVWEGFTGVALTVTVLAWARARVNRQGTLMRQMARASYAVYFLHPPIIVLLALAFSDVTINPTLKLIMVAPIGVTLCYIIALALRQVPGIRRVL